MGYRPISGAVFQYSRNAAGDSADGYYLKLYEAGTTTPLNMATDSTGVTTLAKCALNSLGQPISNNADETTVFVPHINADYKLVLYPTETDADNNTTANAVFVVDNLSLNFLDENYVSGYTQLINLSSTISEYSDGQVITLTDDGIAGSGKLVNTLGHGITTTSGVQVRINDDWYWQRIYQFVTPEIFGVGSDADYTSEMQLFLDFIRDNPVNGRGTGATYRCDQAITLLSTDTSPENYVIDFGGSLLDFSNSALTSGNLFTVGATTTSNAHDKEMCVVTNFDIIGPEPALTTTPSTSLTGFYLENCLNTTIGNIAIRRVYEGVKTNFCFPLTATSVKVRETYIPFRIDDDSTLATWTDCGATDSRYSVVVMPTTNTKTISNQTFINFRTEGCDVGPVLDPLDGSGPGIVSVNFINPYFENNTYDYNRHGIAFNFSTPQTRGADRTREVYNCDIQGGLWSKAAAWGTSPPGAPIVWSTSGTVKGGRYHIPALFSECVGQPNKYQYSNFIDQLTGSGTNTEVFGSHMGVVSFNGSDAAIAFKKGNVDTVTRNSTGVYDVTLIESYDGGNSIIVSGTCGAGKVTVLESSTTSSSVRIECYDNSSSPALFDPDQVRLYIYGELA